MVHYTIDTVKKQAFCFLFSKKNLHGSFINFPVFYKEKKMTSNKKA